MFLLCASVTPKEKSDDNFLESTKKQTTNFSCSFCLIVFFLHSVTDWIGCVTSWSPTGWVCNILNLWVATFDHKAIPGDRQPVSNNLPSNCQHWWGKLPFNTCLCNRAPSATSCIQVIIVYKSKASLCHFAVEWLSCNRYVTVVDGFPNAFQISEVLDGL